MAILAALLCLPKCLHILRNFASIRLKCFLVFRYLREDLWTWKNNAILANALTTLVYFHCLPSVLNFQPIPVDDICMGNSCRGIMGTSFFHAMAIFVSSKSVITLRATRLANQRFLLRNSTNLLCSVRFFSLFSCSLFESWQTDADKAALPIATKGPAIPADDLRRHFKEQLSVSVIVYEILFRDRIGPRQDFSG